MLHLVGGSDVAIDYEPLCVCGEAAVVQIVSAARVFQMAAPSAPRLHPTAPVESPPPLDLPPAAESPPIEYMKGGCLAKTRCSSPPTTSVALENALTDLTSERASAPDL